MKLSAKPFDLSKPSFSGARHLARDRVVTRMRAEGRDRPNAEDSERFAQEFARLLWHVPVWQGGFCHGDDRDVRAQARRLGLRQYYAPARTAMSEWPNPARTATIAELCCEAGPSVDQLSLNAEQARRKWEYA
ncbi:MAG: hypothetical protein HY243_15580 [Proteobacteria bacterium]|nr:hypothetical protein [Pseudomonadota bacterium]